MPHWSYDEGYMYCSKCGEVLTPYQAYFYGFRCPHCRKKIRGDERKVLAIIDEKLRRIIEKI